MASALLLLGFENWYLDAPLELLDQAAAAGIPRILWQFEPLLPPGLPALTHPFVARRSGPSGRPPAERAGIIDQLAHGYRVSKLVVAARRQSWGSAIFSPHVFKYPIQQSRNVASFWDRGLFDHIFVSLRPRAAFLSELQIPSTFVPIGYTPTLGRSAEHGDRDIDVLFFGLVSSRRRALLDKIDAALRKAGYALNVIERDCYGDERTAILNRSKIVLNLHKFPWEFAGQRLLMAMSCRALVVSEWAPDTTPYKHGEHMFTARLEELAGNPCHLAQRSKQARGCRRGGLSVRHYGPARRAIIAGGAGCNRAQDHPMMPQTVKVLILGAQIFAEEVADLVEETPGFEVKGFIENLSPDRCQAHLLGKPVLWVTELGNLEENCHLLCGIGTNRRREYVEQVKLYNLPFATLIHPSARISQTSNVGTGGIISVNAVIAAHSSLGVHTIVNRGVLIGHHTQIGDYVTIAPGANIAGKCVVEDGCYISMGAVIIDRVRIGANSVVGAGAVVTKDVPANVQVVGIPARVVKEGVHGR